MALAPIVLFVYNRPWHTKQTLEALTKNELADQSELFIYADGPKENSSVEQLKNIQEVREIIRENKWCKEVHIIEFGKNKGLADSIISGVTEIVNQFGKVIVLEDDIVTSIFFLKFMNEALDFYEQENKVCSVAGFTEMENKDIRADLFFATKGTSWGWGTWKRIWNHVTFDVGELLSYFENNPSFIEKFNYGSENFYQMLKNQKEGKIDSWAIRFYASCFIHGNLHLTPRFSLVKNIGFDGSGTHCGETTFTHNSFQQEFIPKTFPTEIKDDYNPRILVNGNRIASLIGKRHSNFFLRQLKKIFSQ